MEWNNARDSDYPGRNTDGYLTTDKDPYVLDKSQFTHGLVSHAIKHAKDTGMKEFPSVLQKVKDIYNARAQSEGLFHVIEDRVDTLSNVNGVSEKAFRNSMDYISDKAMNKVELDETERDVLNALKPLVDDYNKAANLITQDPDYTASSKDGNKKVHIKGHLTAIEQMGKLSTFMGFTNKKYKPKQSFYAGEESPNETQKAKAHKLLGENALRQYIRALILERY